MKKRASSFPTPFEVAQLAAQLLPHTSDTVTIWDDGYEGQTAAASFHDRANEAVRMVHMLHTSAWQWQKQIDEPQSEMNDEAEIEYFEQCRLQLDLENAFDQSAKGSSEIEADEYLKVVFRKQRNKPSIDTFMQAWLAFEMTKGCEIPFTRSSSAAALEFLAWYHKHKDTIRHSSTPSDAAAKIAKGRSRGGKNKHRNETKQHGQATLAGGVAEKIDKAIKRRAKTPKR